MKLHEKGRHKRLIGLILILVGLIALVTPFTPGATWFIIIGMHMMGIHLIFLDKIEEKLRFHKVNKKS